MTIGFLVATLIVLVGHVAGFPLAYAYLHTVCRSGCALTPGNVQVLGGSGLSVAFYANLYMVIQVIYVLITVGLALLIVFKKPGQWVPLGMGCYLLSYAYYEGADYRVLIAAHPALYLPEHLLLGLGLGILGNWALITFPNGRFGRRWIAGFYLLLTFGGLLPLFITNPIFVLVITILDVAIFPFGLWVLIYRYHHFLNATEQNSMKWLIVGLSVFILILVVVDITLPAITAPTSLVFLLINTAGFFGCGANIAGAVMAVLYANAFDIDIFVRRTLVYTLLATSLVVVYIGLVVSAPFVLDRFNARAGGSPLILVGSTLVVAALFQPLRQRIQTLIDRRFYRQKYDAAKIVSAFNATLSQEVDLNQLSGRLLAVVQETVQPEQVSLWLRQPSQGELPAFQASKPPLSQAGSQEEIARQDG
jgi:hypothetical protein